MRRRRGVITLSYLWLPLTLLRTYFDSSLSCWAVSQLIHFLLCSAGHVQRMTDPSQSWSCPAALQPFHTQLQSDRVTKYFQNLTMLSSEKCNVKIFWFILIFLLSLPVPQRPANIWPDSIIENKYLHLKFLLSPHSWCQYFTASQQLDAGIRKVVLLYLIVQCCSAQFFQLSNWLLAQLCFSFGPQTLFLASVGHILKWNGI